MSACAAFRPELIDVALGVPPHGALRAHLATCTACAAALAECRSALARIDETVRESVAAEPLAGLTERILARTGHVPAPRAFAGWLPLATAAALVAGIAIATEGFHDGGTSAAHSLAAWRSPTRALLLSHESVVDTPLDIDSTAPTLTRT